MVLVGSIPVSASVGIRTVSISTRARCRTGRQPHAQVRTTGMSAGLRRNDRSVANSQGRKLYRVTLSAQERRDLKAIGHRGRLAQVPMLRGACRCRHCAGHGDGRALALRSGGSGGCPQPQGAGEPSAETAGRGDGGEADRPGLFVPARGLWTLLAGRLVEIVERISEETVRKTLKKRSYLLTPCWVLIGHSAR